MVATFTRFVREMMHISDNVFFISLAVLVSVLVFIVLYWFYTRRKMHELQHQIPATVLKSYLDSVIQNSSALKSSLFRGGGLEISEGIPSVVPSGNLPNSGVGVSGSGDLAQKNAEIAALQGQISTKDSQIRELEKKLAEMPIPSGDASEDMKILQDELAKLRNELAGKETALQEALANVGSGSGEGGEEVEALKTENKDLKDRLQEYGIIEEDLANLRKLQQENEQLKQTIDQMGGAAAPAEAAPVAEESAPPGQEPAAEEPAPAADVPEQVADGEEDLEAAMAAAITEPAAAEPAAAKEEEMVPANEGEQKSAEELLSEFEKMLG